MREGVTKFAAFVDRTGRFRRHVARDAAGKGELGEEALHALFIRRYVWVDFAVSAFKVGVCDEAGSAMAGPGDVDHVEVVLLDYPVQVNVDEVQARCRSPMAEEPRLDVFPCKGLL